MFLRSLRIDTENASVSMWASKELPIQHRGDFHIRDELCHTGDLFEGVNSRQFLANVLVAQEVTSTIGFALESVLTNRIDCWDDSRLL